MAGTPVAAHPRTPGREEGCPVPTPHPGHPAVAGTLTSLRWHHWQIPQRTMVTLRLTVMMAETRRTSREGAPAGKQSRAATQRGDREGARGCPWGGHDCGTLHSTQGELGKNREGQTGGMWSS